MFWENSKYVTKFRMNKISKKRHVRIENMTKEVIRIYVTNSVRIYIVVNAHTHAQLTLCRNITKILSKL